MRLIETELFIPGTGPAHKFRLFWRPADMLDDMIVANALEDYRALMVYNSEQPLMTAGGRLFDTKGYMIVFVQNRLNGKNAYLTLHPYEVDECKVRLNARELRNNKMEVI